MAKALELFDKITSHLPHPKPHALIAKKEQREAYKRQLRENQEWAKRERQLMNVTDFPVQINPHVIASLEDAWFIAGMRGSGKTTWVKQYIPRVIQWWGVPVYILDSKGQNEFDSMASEIQLQQTAPTAPAHEGQIVVWKPPLDDYQEYDKWLGMVLKSRQPCLIVLDELSSIGRGKADTYPVNYQLILKQGRGLKISIVSMTQEVAYIPRQTTGQTSHILRFHMINSYDIAAASRYLGMPENERFLEPPLPHGFFYRRVDKPSPIYSFTNWQEFFMAGK